ncbi:MAG: GNAT family N-acetyltransferase [Balneola sp.]|nr:GNAT family N-acetyltransferase [Balneola sp.]|tara:strand:+ start:237477 stop:237755 length:279 start_codon:yes stop_codon:yes gene_type:complete
MEIQHESTDTKGTFFIEKDGKRIAEMTYSKAGTDKIIIDHTEADEAYRGEGLAKKLVFHGVEFARENELKVLPLCPYAKSVIQRNEELQDVL